MTKKQPSAQEIKGELLERPDDANPGTPMPIPEPPGGWPADEFTGRGGRYLRDPFTGQRRLIAQEGEAEPGTTPPTS